jgi:hypothetical protein
MTKTLKAAAVIASGNATITFEDQGQDFLAWDVKDRKVVACRPFQADLWVGSEVLSFPEVGKTVEIQMPKDRGGRRVWVKYPLVKVEALRMVEEKAP